MSAAGTSTVVDSYSLRYRLTLSAAAVNSSSSSQQWVISICVSEAGKFTFTGLEFHFSLSWYTHCTCFLMIQSVSATWSLRFLTSQTQLLKLNIKRKWKAKKRKKKVTSFYRNGNTKMNWRVQKQMHEYQASCSFLHIFLLLCTMIENAKDWGYFILYI